MKNKNKYLILFAVAIFAIAGCSDFLDTKIDRITTPDRAETNSGTLTSFANSFYTSIQYGYIILDANLFAAATDEAQQTSPTGNMSYFNRGILNENVNPLSSLYQLYYEGIRAAYFFLDYAKNGEEFLLINRDLEHSDPDRQAYRRAVRTLGWYRAEAKIAMAYYYSELIKLYGGVPIITTTMENDPFAGAHTRASYDDVVEHIVSLIDDVLDDLQTDWAGVQTINGVVEEGWIITSQAGRFDKAAALAIKARTLLYAASPRNNPGNNPAKWERAALAAHDLIVFKDYTMPENRDYGAYFRGSGASGNDESIYLVRRGVSNSPEMSNYPIATPGGNSGVTPSHNLVSAYEQLTGPSPNPEDPYAHRDPRLQATVVVNGSTWNNRMIDQSSGGSDDMDRTNASTTGYYLKKFLTDNLNLTASTPGTANHLWHLYRYAEVLLNYAEAMNEIYTPDEIPAGFTLSARDALMQVRNSASTSLPPVTTTDRTEFKNALKRERMIELAFEDHRYWDLIRWGDAENVLNKPIQGVRVTKIAEETEEEPPVFEYQVVDVATRTFLPRMNYMPFTRAEVVKSNGKLIQNEGYN